MLIMARYGNLLLLIAPCCLLLIHGNPQIDGEIATVRLALNRGNLENPEYHWEKLGNLLLTKDTRGRDDGLLLRLEAENAFSNALKITDEDSLKYRLNLRIAGIQSENGKEEEASASYAAAFDVADGHVEEAFALYSQGKFFSHYGHYAEAVTVLKSALKLSPTFLSVYLPLVESHRELNKFKTENWRVLLKELEQKLFKASVLEVDLDTEGNAVRATHVAPEDQQSCDAYWALFLICDKLDEEKLAWLYLNKAHDIRREQIPSYSQEMAATQSQSIISIFKPSFWPDPSLHIGSESTFPVFIVGMPRSGASVLEAMLASHKEMYGTGDGSVYSSMSMDVRNDLIMEIGKPRESQRMREVLGHNANRVIQSMKDAIYNDTTISQLKKKRIRHFVDKTLSSFKSVGVVHYAFPKALILNVIRDPMDTIFSCYTNRISDNDTTVWSLDQADLTHEYIQYLQVTDHYRNVLPDVFIDVSYEALVTAPEATLTPILKRLGLEWDPNMLDFHKQKRIVKLNSRQQLRKGLSDESFGRWKKYSYQLLPASVFFKKVLPLARDKNLVPFINDMNWDIDDDYVYPSMLISNHITEEEEEDNNNNKEVKVTKKKSKKTKKKISKKPTDDKKKKKKKKKKGSKKKKSDKDKKEPTKTKKTKKTKKKKN